MSRQFDTTLLAAIVGLACLSPMQLSQASEQTLPLGGIPCEADWINRSRFDTVPTLGFLQWLERQAGRGEVGAQLRLGQVLKTQDGKWTTPEDRSYNIRWLEMAQAQGSKSAVWELARIQRKSTTHEEFLRSAMTAAEEEGNPWAASYLMDLTSGRFGMNRSPTRCLKEMEVGGKCAPDDLLQTSSARKWAEIAAEGGNAQAQQWLCWAASDSAPDRGQPQDDKAALKWCQIAVHNACASFSLGRLETLYRRGAGGNPPNGNEADRIGLWSKQPWRTLDHYFFYTTN